MRRSWRLRDVVEQRIECIDQHDIGHVEVHTGRAPTVQGPHEQILYAAQMEGRIIVRQTTPEVAMQGHGIDQVLQVIVRAGDRALQGRAIVIGRGIAQPIGLVIKNIK